MISGRSLEEQRTLMERAYAFAGVCWRAEDSRWDVLKMSPIRMKDVLERLSVVDVLNVPLFHIFV